jgi:uncharacterized protein (DUF1330 family)
MKILKEDKSMSVYLSIQFNIKDAEAFQIYSSQVGDTVKLYGGKTVGVSKMPQSLVGNPENEFFVLQQWPSLEDAQAWHESKEYAPLKTLRDEQAISELKIIVIPSVS